VAATALEAAAVVAAADLATEAGADVGTAVEDEQPVLTRIPMMMMAIRRTYSFPFTSFLLAKLTGYKLNEISYAQPESANERARDRRIAAGAIRALSLRLSYAPTQKKGPSETLSDEPVVELKHALHAE
jgi:hypothetical protein